MNDFDLLRPAARQRTSNGLRRPRRHRVACTLTSNLFKVAPCHMSPAPTAILTPRTGVTSSPCWARERPRRSAEGSTYAPVLPLRDPLAATPVSCRHGDDGRGSATRGGVRDHPAGGRAGGVGRTGGEGPDQGRSPA